MLKITKGWQPFCTQGAEAIMKKNNPNGNRWQPFCTQGAEAPCLTTLSRLGRLTAFLYTEQSRSVY